MKSYWFRVVPILVHDALRSREETQSRLRGPGAETGVPCVQPRNAKDGQQTRRRCERPGAPRRSQPCPGTGISESWAPELEKNEVLLFWPPYSLPAQIHMWHRGTYRWGPSFCPYSRLYLVSWGSGGGAEAQSEPSLSGPSAAWPCRERAGQTLGQPGQMEFQECEQVRVSPCLIVLLNQLERLGPTLPLSPCSTQCPPLAPKPQH